MRIPLPFFKKRWAMEWLEDRWSVLNLLVERLPRMKHTNVYKGWTVYLYWRSF